MVTKSSWLNAVLALSATPLPSAAHTAPVPELDCINKTAVSYEPAPGLPIAQFKAKLDEHKTAHKAYSDKLLQEAEGIESFGQFMNGVDEVEGALFIFKSVDAVKVKKWIGQDPYVKNGVFTSTISLWKHCRPKAGP